MALRVWLPLTGTLENKGVSNLSTFSYNTFTQQTDGKIGKCYSGQGIYHIDNELIQNEWSLCTWVKSNAWSQYNDIILCKNTTASDNCQFYFSIINGASLNIGINAGSGSASYSYTFATNTWYHVAATYNGSTYVLYINGTQVKTGTITNTLKTGMNNIGINCRSTNAAGTGSTGDGGKKLNDVRIYDHCLSAAEVKEISQGLVLHYKLDDITNGIIDSSGYGHNGSYVNATITASEAHYSKCIACLGTTVNNSSNTITGAQFFYCNMDMPSTDNITISWWGKNVTYGRGGIFETSNTIQTDTTKGTDYNTTAFANWDSTFGIYNGSTRINIFTNFNKNGSWHHHAITYDGVNVKYYCDNILKQTSALTGNLPAWKSFCMGLGKAGGVWRQIQQYVSDLRIYTTALSADDIKQLYNVAAKIDNLGNLHTFEAVEELPNIIFKIDSARGAKIFQDGLSRYTQANCQVTLTDDGYRIYRPPNLTTSNDGNTMYGGLKLVNQSTDTVSPYNATRDNIWGLQQNHTYLFAFHIKGQSSNIISSFGWSNNMGWGVGGVAPSPTQIVRVYPPSNFNGERDCFYMFTINDSIVKTSNDARGGYDGSSQYLSYRHIVFNWGYSNTDTLGTDVYLTDFRLYDITNIIGKIKKIGQADFANFVEKNGMAQIRKQAEFLTNTLIER